jgi:hypothetical protein
MEKWFVKDSKESPVIEVWETLNGDLYFVVEKQGDEMLCFARLYSMPQFAEWGWNQIEYLKEQYGSSKIWKVAKTNWGNINSYEKGLFNLEVKK